jgi:hypothetical protein
MVGFDAPLIIYDPEPELVTASVIPPDEPV